MVSPIPCWLLSISKKPFILTCIAFHGVSAQDFAAHGYFTEPNTNITFYTSTEVNGTIVGDGEFSLVSRGGYTFGIALPPTAATVDSYDYIGLIVSSLPSFSNTSH